MYFGSKKKEVKLSNAESGVLITLKDHPSCIIKLRNSSLKGNGLYCLYTKDGSPICSWPRPLIDGLIEKGKIDWTRETGVFILL